MTEMMDDMVVGMGEILWDVLPGGKRMGGAPANFAYHVSQFGLQSCVVSAVGHDADGEEILRRLVAEGVEHMMAEVDYPTGTVQVEVDADGVPRYDITENVAWDNIPYTDSLERLAGRTRAVCFGSLAQRGEVSRDTIGRFLDAMPRRDDTLVVFDINLRQKFYTKDILHRSMERCNVLKINDEELDVVGRMFDCRGLGQEDKCRELVARYGLRMLILTCGVSGSYVFTPDEESFQPTPVVEVADTVGAGDSFTAAFIANVLKGKTVAEAHAVAVAASAYVCTCEGAMPVLPGALTGC